MKTLFFDLGEVVLSNDWLFFSPEKDAEFYGHYRITPDAFTAARQPLIAGLMTGTMTESEYWHRLLTDAGASDTDCQFAISLSRRYQTEKPGMPQLLDGLKRAGYPMAVISDTHREIFDYKRERFGLDRWFSAYVTSFDIGVRKPDPRIYAAAAAVMQTTPDRSIFIDDTRGNVAGAAGLGFAAIQFTDAVSLRAELARVGVQPKGALTV